MGLQWEESEQTHPGKVASAGTARKDGGGTKPFEHSGKRPHQGAGSAQAIIGMNIEQASKRAMRTPTPLKLGEGWHLPGRTPWVRGARTRQTSDKSTGGVRRSSGDGMRAGEFQRNMGSPPRWDQVAPTGTPRRADRAGADGGEARSSEEAGNDRRAKEPQFQGNVSRSNGAEFGASLTRIFHAFCVLFTAFVGGQAVSLRERASYAG